MKKLESKIFVILDNVRSAFNVGSVFRICDCAGVDSLFLTGISPYPPHNKIPKTALGAEESVYWEYHKDPIELIKLLKAGSIEEASKKALFKSSLSHTFSKSITTIASFEINEESQSLYKSEFNFPLAMVFGHELTGINPEILKMSDQIIHIPMVGKKESLNISTSAGIGIYEIYRRIH